jgi:DNA-binding SARP family transcriptional activator/tetratricopeptide (TPR) repeat protein/transcriptional regulator with XRE-family HTH domain
MTDRTGGSPEEGFAALVRTWRRAAGLTQAELAAKAGLSLAAVRDLEQGRRARPRPASVTRLADSLSLDAARRSALEAAARRPPASAGAERAGGRYAGPPADDSGLRIQVLGPVGAWRGKTPLALGGPQQRAVLGLLAVHAGAVVARAMIIDALWGDDPPASAANVVQGHVSRLRGVLRSISPDLEQPDGLVVSAGAGYRLVGGIRHVDLLAFANLTGQARAAAAAGHATAACTLYERALELWGGDPLAGCAIPQTHPAVTALAAKRVQAVVDYANTATGAGWHDRVLDLLRTTAGAELLDEQVHAALMIALAGSGHQAAALGVFEDMRRRLDEELGVRPGAELARAQQRVLSQDVPALSRPAAASAPRRATQPSSAERVPPRQLPAAVPYFTGRGHELMALSALLNASAGPGGTVVISAIGGAAGVGKTALTVHWAHQVADRFPDGQLYVNLHGYDPMAKPVPPSDAIRGFLGALGVAPARIPADLDGLAGLYRSLLAGRRMLVVLDNARDAEQVRPLLPGDSGCLVLVTSRDQLAGLISAEGARPVTLDLLAESEARELLARRLGTARTAAEAESVTELTRLCARLPLALSIAAARAELSPGLPLAALAAELNDARTRLDALSIGDAAINVRAVFACSYQGLSEPAARMFRLLGIHPGPDISAPTAASLAAMPLLQARGALRELTGARLLTVHPPNRFACHDLLRAYAAEQARTHDGEDTLRVAVRRVLDHYLHTAHHAALILHPARDPLPVPPAQDGVTPERPAGNAAALEWFEAERHALLAAIRLAGESGFDTHAWQIPAAMTNFLDWQGHWHDWATTQRAAVAAARRIGDEAGQADCHHNLGYACARLGDYTTASCHLAQALIRYQRLGNLTGQARVQHILAMAFGRQELHAEALDHARSALALYQADGHKQGQAGALNAVGWSSAHLGDYEDALACCQRALGLHAELGNRHGQATAWDSIGYARHRIGQHELAISCYQEALGLFSELGDRDAQAETLTHLGDAEYATGQVSAARTSWQQALAILDELHVGAEEVRARLSAHQVPGPESGNQRPFGMKETRRSSAGGAGLEQAVQGRGGL